MAQITASLDDELLREFRDVIYQKRGLKKGDFKVSLEEALQEYIQKYSKNKN